MTCSQLPVNTIRCFDAQVGMMMIAALKVRSLVGVKWKTSVRMMSLNWVHCFLPRAKWSFAALVDAETVPARTQELGVIRYQ